MYKTHYYIIAFILLLGSCKKSEKIQRVSDAPILAEVNNTKLYLDQLEDGGLLNTSHTKEDSTQVINAYVQKWIKDRLLLSEAEKALSSDIDIDMLVQDYRESLLLYNYENVLVSNQLDTTITQAQIDTYYKENSGAFKLAEPILKCRIAVVDGKKSKLERFYANWKAEKMESINSYLKTNSTSYYMDEEKWYSESEVLNLTANSIKAKELKSKKTLQEAKGGNEYFVKVLQFIDKSEDPPLAYVVSNIKKIILHQRKSKLILKLKDDLYQREINSSNVRIHQRN